MKNKYLLLFFSILGIVLFYASDVMAGYYDYIVVDRPAKNRGTGCSEDPKPLGCANDTHYWTDDASYPTSYPFSTNVNFAYDTYRSDASVGIPYINSLNVNKLSNGNYNISIAWRVGKWSRENWIYTARKWKASYVWVPSSYGNCVSSVRSIPICNIYTCSNLSCSKKTSETYLGPLPTFGGCSSYQLPKTGSCTTIIKTKGTDVLGRPQKVCYARCTACAGCTFQMQVPAPDTKLWYSGALGINPMNAYNHNFNNVPFNDMDFRFISHNWQGNAIQYQDFYMRYSMSPAPGNFSIASVNSSCPANGTTQRNVISWGGSSYAERYDIYRNGSYIASTTGTSYTDNRAHQTSDSYRILATSEGGSTWSLNTVSATGRCCLSIPPVPTNIITSGECSGEDRQDNTITWTAPSTSYSTTGYDIYYKYRRSDGTWSADTYAGSTSGRTSTTFVHRNQPTNYYYYKIRSKNECGVGSLSDQMFAQKLTCKLPAEFSITDISSVCATNILTPRQNDTITWNESEYATGYDIFTRYQRNDGTWTSWGSPIANLSYQSHRYTASGRPPRSQYYVRATNSLGTRESNRVQADNLNCKFNVSINVNCNYDRDEKTIRLNWSNIQNSTSYTLTKINENGSIVSGTPKNLGAAPQSMYSETIPMDQIFRYRITADISSLGITAVSNDVPTSLNTMRCMKTFNVGFIGKEINLNTRATLTINPDTKSGNNPPPGFGDLLAPLWKELVP